jgi:uncharacterized membrane protein
MEWFLLIVIIGVLIINFSYNKSREIRTQDMLQSLHKKLDAIQKELVLKATPIEKAEKPTTVEKPIIIPEKNVPEVIKPVVVAPVMEKPIAVVERAAFQSEPVPFRAPKPIVPQKSWFETFKEKNPDLEKFIGENLISKFGILILVLGISFFVKFAIAKDWINEPARVGIGVLCGALVMGIAHKLKKNYAAFSSVLVAGAISIFYFTIAIAFHEYQLFSQTVAFVIMTVITVFSVLVSVSYNRQELAILSLIGGFAVPFMVSTGEGNYAVLFSYIAILNTGILAIAYFKKWKIVSILAFVFTALLFVSWYTRELYDDKLPHLGALLFATVFYFIFSTTIVLSNIRNKGVFSMAEYFIMVANTFFFFGVGMGIIHNWGIDFKGLFSLLLALYNVVYAVILYRKFGLDKNAIYLLIGLALTFLTLTIPLQFEGNQITLFWAAEAVLLFWLSQKSKIERFKWGAVIVQLLTIVSLLMDWFKYIYPVDPLKIVFNPLFIAGIFVSLSLFLAYWLLKKESYDKKILIFSLPFYRTSVVVLAVIVTYFTGFLEINYQAYQLLANTASALSFLVLYHFVFVAFLLFLVLKMKQEIMENGVLILASVSIVLYIVSFYSLPNNEMIQNFVGHTTTQYAFYFHYIILGCLIYFGFQLFKKANQIPKITLLNRKIMPWLFVFAAVYILSNEVMVHSLVFSKDTIDTAQIQASILKSSTDGYTINLEKRYLYENKLEGIKAQIIKIGYPIVWGLFSFIFLIIGIKKQWKNLRIISLSLLGITILKLFIYDIKNVSETGKIIAFILLGVLILIISFVYQKVKKLVVEDAPKTNSDEENS